VPGPETSTRWQSAPSGSSTSDPPGSAGLPSPDRLELGLLEELAAKLLPRGVFDYFAGGAEDEQTLEANVRAWSKVPLRPRVLRDVASVSLGRETLGGALRAPLGVAPVAYQTLAHPDGEVATAAGSAEAGALFVLSSRTARRIEDVAATRRGAPWWFQCYVFEDRSLTKSLVGRAIGAGCSALVLTGDTPVLGLRRRDLRNGFSGPQALFRASQGGDDLVDAEAVPTASASVVESSSVTFSDVGWLVEAAGGVPVLVKGVLRADDALAAMDAGASGVVVSNHGGRQLDGAVATAFVLEEVAAALRARDPEAAVWVDGGIRRGRDVLGALALGADGVLVGRPAIWGLASAGAAGVQRVMETLAAELELAMRLAGCASLADVTADLVAALPAWACR